MKQDLKSMQSKTRPPAQSRSENDVRDAITAELRDQYPEKKTKGDGPSRSSPYVSEIFFNASDGTFVCDHDGEKYRQGWKANADGTITLTGTREEVVRKTIYESVGDKDEAGDE